MDGAGHLLRLLGACFVNGYLDELAHDIGAIDRSLQFSVLKVKSHINERARAANGDPRFSVRIRQGLPQWCEITR
jgi:hypothetical protein